MAKTRINCSMVFMESVGVWLEGATLQAGGEAIGYSCISGSLISSEFSANIRIMFQPDHLKKHPPIVFCKEPWIRRDLDWHCFRAAGPKGVWKDLDRLCWIHPFEWERAHDHKTKRLAVVISEGAEWLKNNLHKLLERHWTGHALGIKNWPSEWGGWGHGNTGTQQFLVEMKKLGHPANWHYV